uniref:Uncharacterized protein n=1 Tax=Anguilla anguilla TaxID=7936 RepID=A0A0E9RWU8_ANGAN
MKYMRFLNNNITKCYLISKNTLYVNIVTNYIQT